MTRITVGNERSLWLWGLALICGLTPPQTLQLSSFFFLQRPHHWHLEKRGHLTTSNQYSKCQKLPANRQWLLNQFKCCFDFIHIYVDTQLIRGGATFSCSSPEKGRKKILRRRSLIFCKVCCEKCVEMSPVSHERSSTQQGALLLWKLTLDWLHYRALVLSRGNVAS